MRKKLAIAAAAGLVALAVGMAWAWASPGLTAPVTLTVIEHETTLKYIDTGRPGDSSGDLITFHNRVYDEADEAVVGSDQGQCIRISPKAGTWECAWTTFLEDGQITVAGPFFDTEDSTLAVTGGTGAYDNARGSMDLESMEGGAKYGFTFNLLP